MNSFRCLLADWNVKGVKLVCWLANKTEQTISIFSLRLAIECHSASACAKEEREWLYALRCSSSHADNKLASGCRASTILGGQLSRVESRVSSGATGWASLAFGEPSLRVFLFPFSELSLPFLACAFAWTVSAS